MMKKTKSAKKTLLSGVALLALTSGVCGFCALNTSNSVSEYADSQTLIEFTESDVTTTGVNSSLVTNVDIDSDEVPDVSSAWKIDLNDPYGAVTFKEPLQLTGAKGIQIRMYIHWSPETLTTEDALCVYKNAIVDQAWADGSIWAFWKGVDQADRPLIQDQWVTFTITDKFPMASLEKLCIVPYKAAGRQTYEDAYILVDKITAIKDGDTVNGANVVTEFGADQVSHAGQGWRSDLLTAGDDGIHGATTAWKAKVTPGVVSVSFPEVNLNVLYGKNLKGLQIRMYAHLGKITGDTNIEVQLNGETKGHWASEASGLFDTTRPIIQDQWITYTLAENFSLASLSKLGFNFPANGITYHDDAYILVDKITTIEDTAPMGKNVVTEFAADQISQSGKGWRTDLINDVDTDGDGEVDAKNAWRVNLDTGVASTGITFANALDLSAYAGIQFRVYVHWGTNFGADSQLSFCANTFKPGHAYDGVFALWKGSDQADRPMKQDEWITFTVAENLPATSLSSLGIYITPNGVNAYDDAYILIDKIVGIPKTGEALDKNVITEFAANEVSHDGQGWRTDLVTDMDENNQGATNALRFDPHYSDLTFTLAKGYDMTGVKALQFRMYLHLGESLTYAGNGPVINMYANGTEHIVNWINNSAYRQFVQDQWITFTVTNGLDKFENTFKKLKLAFSKGDTNLYDDAYILIDNITAVKETTNGEGVLTDFAFGQITHEDLGWCSDFASNVDTDGDGKVDAENAYRLNCSYRGGDYPSLVFTDPISLSGVKSFHLRMFVHWGEISSEGAGMTIKVVTPSGAQKDLIFMWSDDKLKQDQWLDFYLKPDEVANLGDSITGIVVQKMNGAKVSEYDDAYILFDKMYEVKYAVTFNHGEGLGTEKLEVSEGLTVTAPDCKKEGRSVKWYYMNGDEKVYYNASATVNSDITYLAEYTINTYTVTVVRSDGAAALKLPVNHGAAADLSGAEKVGYTVAIYTDAAMTAEYTADTPVTGNVTLYAKYTPIEYTVTYMDGETVVATKKVNYDATAPEQASKPGHTVKWYTDADCTNEYNFATLITGDLTLYAKYTINTYTVTFDHPDGYEDKQVTVAWNGKVSADACQDSGKNVVWYSDSEYKNVFDFTTPITADTTLYAKYVTSVYTVTFDHGTFGNSDPQKVEHGGKATAQASLNEAYTVTWYSDAEFTELYDFNNEVTGALTLYGKYVIKTYTVTFVHGESIYNEVVENVEHGAKVEAKASKKTGYTVEWYADEIRETKFDFNKTITAVTIIYAKYTPIEYTVTYMDGETVVATKKVNYDATAPEQASKPGHTVKWYTDADCTNEYNFATLITGDLTLYAKYTINTYTVTVVRSDGAADLKLPVNHGAAADLSGAEKVGYTVAIYTDAAMTAEYTADTPVTGNVTLYAKYTPIEYTVTYMDGNTVVTTEKAKYDATAPEKASNKTGYTVKWYTDADCINEYNFATLITGDLTLYAKYTIETYTITFNHEDGAVNVSVDYNNKVTAAASTKPGYSVTWYYMNGATKVYFDYDAGVTADCVLQPEYRIITYKVTFDHGTFGTQSVNATYGTTVTKPDGKDDSYTVEWYEDAAFTTLYNFETAISGHTTIYGKYVIKTHTVTFVHGESIDNEVVENVEHGAKVEAKAGQKEGYTVRWYADEEHTTEFDFANVTITADTTIYAVYTINTYTVTVVLGGDAQNLTLTVNHGATADLSGAEKNGYTVALYTDETMTVGFTADTPITGNITLYVKYTKNKRSGCGSEVGVGSVLLSTAMAGVALAGALVVRKKKEDD